MATTQQVLMGGNPGTVLATGVASYFPVMGGALQDADAEANVNQVIPTAGEFSNLLINFDGSPGAGKSYTATLYINGSPSALTIAVSDSATQGEDLTHSASVSPGDLVSVCVTPSGTPTARKTSFSLLFVPTIAGETILMGTVASGYLQDSTYYGFCGRCYTDQGSGVWQQIIAPCPGTLKKLYLNASVAPGLGNSRIGTIYNPRITATGITVTLGASDTTGNDSVNTSVVSAGNTFLLFHTVSGTPASSILRISCVFVPDTAGNFILPSLGVGGAAYDIVDGNNYFAVSKNAVGEVAKRYATEAPIQLISHAFTAKAIYVDNDSYPGAGLSYVYTLRKTGVSSALTVTVVDTNYKGNAAADVSITKGDKLSTYILASVNSANGAPSIHYLGYIAPSGVGGLFFAHG